LSDVAGCKAGVAGCEAMSDQPGGFFGRHGGLVIAAVMLALLGLVIILNI
jgi:hypothetical protein